jgi:16S rRNA (cytidine1402-2'-O)-methyltransferase
MPQAVGAQSGPAAGSSHGSSPASAIDWRGWLAPLQAGESVGLMSDAGCPGVADPGAALVQAAHDAGIEVHPLIGPSSLLLGLMASGLNGQHFTFQGYLPVQGPERRRAIERLAQRSAAERETVLVIETPYRNQATAEALVEVLPAAARLCIALDLTGPGESIVSRAVSAWRARAPALPRKLPAVFLFQC